MVAPVLRSVEDVKAAATSTDGEESSDEEDSYREIAEGEEHTRRRVAIVPSTSRHQQRQPALHEPPTARAWVDLVADLGAVHLGYGSRDPTVSRKPHVARCRSDQTLFTRKRGAEDEGTPAINPGFSFAHETVMDDEGALSLGAPPPLPPKLKRARACSYSPNRSHLSFFSGLGESSSRDGDHDYGPRQ